MFNKFDIIYLGSCGGSGLLLRGLAGGKLSFGAKCVGTLLALDAPKRTSKNTTIETRICFTFILTLFIKIKMSEKLST
jgi:hypothetical protein